MCNNIIHVYRHEWRVMHLASSSPVFGEQKSVSLVGKDNTLSFSYMTAHHLHPWEDLVSMGV